MTITGVLSSFSGLSDSSSSSGDGQIAVSKINTAVSIKTFQPKNLLAAQD